MDAAPADPGCPDRDDARETLSRRTLVCAYDRSSAAALRATHQRLAQGSDHGVWKVVPGSDHLIASSQPQAVVEAVTKMIVDGYDRSP